MKSRLVEMATSLVTSSVAFPKDAYEEADITREVRPIIEYYGATDAGNTAVLKVRFGWMFGA